MRVNDARLLDVPHSRGIIASLDPQHDSYLRVPTPLEAGPSKSVRTYLSLRDARISVARVWPRIHLEASRTCDGGELPRAATPAVALRRARLAETS